METLDEPALVFAALRWQAQGAKLIEMLQQQQLYRAPNQ